MKRKIFLTIFLLVVGMSIVSFFAGKLFSSKPNTQVANSIYDFKINGLDGREIDFASYKGKKLLIVNTASKCGKTPQYAGLEKLHEQFGNRVNVLGFPANNFLWQEPGTSEEIAEFCEKNYGVRFQMFEKVSVKGSDQHPLYQWLEMKTGKHPDWNFAKFLVSEDGTQVTFFNSSIKPLDEAIISQIQ